MSRYERLRVTFSTGAAVCALAAYVLLCLATAEGPLSGDDHYSLWAAAAAAAGDRPNIDFFDPGSPLQWWLSYVGQLATGGRTIGEIVVAVCLKTIGMVAVFMVSARLLGRWNYAWLPTCIVVLMLLAYQVYGADKVFIYPLAVLASWRYLEGRTPPSVLGLVIGVAFLFRHDHGFYIGVFLAAAMLVGPGPRVRSLVTAGVCALAVCAPWLWWVASTEGLGNYFLSRVSFARGLGLTEVRPLFSTVTPLWSFENVARFLWHVALATPLLGIVVGIRRRHRAAVLMCGLLLMMEAGIMRRGIQVKETAILWVPLFCWLLLEVRRGPAAWVLRGVGVAALAATIFVTGAFERLSALAAVEGGLVARAGRAVQFHARPRRLEDYVSPTDRSERLLVRYVAECLSERDRIWDTSVWFPLSYYSNRRPAWHPYWELGFLRDDGAQRRFLAWIRMRSAPVIIVRRRDGDIWSAFAQYPRVRAYVAQHYRQVTSPEFDRFVKEGNVAQVLVDSRRTAATTFESLGLPCFRSP